MDEAWESLNNYWTRSSVRRVSCCSSLQMQTSVSWIRPGNHWDAYCARQAPWMEREDSSTRMFGTLPSTCILSQTRSNTKDCEWSAVRHEQYVHAYLVGTVHWKGRGLSWLLQKSTAGQSRKCEGQTPTAGLGYHNMSVQTRLKNTHVFVARVLRLCMHWKPIQRKVRLDHLMIDRPSLDDDWAFHISSAMQVTQPLTNQYQPLTLCE